MSIEAHQTDVTKHLVVKAAIPANADALSFRN